MGRRRGREHDEYIEERREDVEDQIVDLLRRRQRIDEQIQELQIELGHLAALSGGGYDPLLQLGLTNAVRNILGRGSFLRIRDIVSALTREGIGHEHRNLSANVSTVIDRLLKSGEVAEKKGFSGYYTWKGGDYPPLSIPESLRERVANVEKKKPRR